VIPTRRVSRCRRAGRTPYPVLHADCARSFPHGARRVRLHGRDDRRSGPRAPRARRYRDTRALAADGDAYAIPVAHHYDAGSLYVRLSTDGSSTKLSYLEETETACFTLYDVDESGDSWSIVVTGPLRKLTGRERTQFDEAAVNESFLELRIFDEDVAAVDLGSSNSRSSRLPGGRPATNAVGRTAQYRPSGRQPACSHGQPLFAARSARGRIHRIEAIDLGPLPLQ